MTQISTERRAAQAGFSLVELAIVLIIIGLIVGGVLKGQDLIESARVNSIQTQLNEVRVASTTFLNKYDALPGDIIDTDLFTTSASIIAGNGNGRLDGAGPRMGAVSNNTAGGSEPVMFWAHLQEAGLLGGVSVAVDTGVGTEEVSMAGENALSSQVGGLYTIKWDDLSDAGEIGAGDVTNAHWLLLGGVADATDDSILINDEPVLTPVQLRGIDQRADDGRPTTGNVVGAGTDGTVDCDDGANEYTSDDAAVSCYAGFKL